LEKEEEKENRREAGREGGKKGGGRPSPAVLKSSRYCALNCPVWEGERKRGGGRVLLGGEGRGISSVCHTVFLLHLFDLLNSWTKGWGGGGGKKEGRCVKEGGKKGRGGEKFNPFLAPHVKNFPEGTRKKKKRKKTLWWEGGERGGKRRKTCEDFSFVTFALATRRRGGGGGGGVAGKGGKKRGRWTSQLIIFKTLKYRGTETKGRKGKKVGREEKEGGKREKRKEKGKKQHLVTVSAIGWGKEKSGENLRGGRKEGTRNVANIFLKH